MLNLHFSSPSLIETFNPFGLCCSGIKELTQSPFHPQIHFTKIQLICLAFIADLSLRLYGYAYSLRKTLDMFRFLYGILWHSLMRRVVEC
mgnify:CR=1 FL=1